MQKVLILKRDELPTDAGWLATQPCPVIACGSGNGSLAAADVLVADYRAAAALEQRIQRFPIASMVLVQVLRSTEMLSWSQALDMESLAYSTLQAGPEFSAWRASRGEEGDMPVATGEPVLLRRNGAVVEAVLNRASSRNAISVEMRDALVDMLQLLEADPSIEQVQLSANGACFSVGGELREFGTAPDPATAHWVRSVQSPARLFAKWSPKITCRVHGACIGSGIELPAFASRLVAHPKSFFQLPELQLGLIPGAGGTVSIARRIGRQRTAWMVLSGKRVNASTALEWGLVDELLPVNHQE